MNFHFNEEEQEILDMLHDYAVKEVAPRAHEIDEEEKFPMEARNGLAEMGMMGMYFPEEYGGAGLSYLSYIAVCEELAVHCATTSVVLSAHESLCAGLFTNMVQKIRRRNTLQLLHQARSQVLSV